MTLLRSNEDALEKDTQAPDFSLKNINEEVVSLSDFKEKPVLIIFMCNHCPYVIPKMDEIAQIQNQNPDCIVLCISSNDPNYTEEDSFENMKLVAKEHGFKYYLFDETQEVAKAYGAVCTPDCYLFDKDHKLVYRGRINDDVQMSNNANIHDLLEVVPKVINNEEIKDWFRYSMGCSIKWK